MEPRDIEAIKIVREELDRFGISVNHMNDEQLLAAINLFRQVSIQTGVSVSDLTRAITLLSRI